MEGFAGRHRLRTAVGVVVASPPRQITTKRISFILGARYFSVRAMLLHTEQPLCTDARKLLGAVGLKYSSRVTLIPRCLVLREKIRFFTRQSLELLFYEAWTALRKEKMVDWLMVRSFNVIAMLIIYRLLLRKIHSKSVWRRLRISVVFCKNEPLFQTYF